MLQKNVLDYLDSSAARFPHKLAFADEARSFTFGQLRACARGLGTALADLGPQHNRPVAVLVNHTAANLAAFFGVLEAGHFYVPLDLQMPLPRAAGDSGDPLPCRAGLPRRGGDPGPGPGGPVPGAVCGGGILPIPPRTPCWMPAGGGCWTSTRCTPFSPPAPPAPPRGSSSPTAASDFTEWMPTPVSLPTRT